MIRYKGHTISAEFRGHDKPPEQVVRKLAPCGTYAEGLVGGFDSVDAAIAAIDHADAVALAARASGTVTVRASSCRDNGSGVCTSCSTVHTMPKHVFDVPVGEPVVLAFIDRPCPPGFFCVHEPKCKGAA